VFLIGRTLLSVVGNSASIKAGFAGRLMLAPTGGRFISGFEREVSRGAVHEVARGVGEPLVGLPGVIAQQRERLVHGQVEALGQLALGLLDNDPAVQGGLELLGRYRPISPARIAPIVSGNAKTAPTPIWRGPA
jgi:hypothetical protein